MSFYVFILSCFESFSPSPNLFMNRITEPPKNTWPCPTLVYRVMSHFRTMLLDSSSRPLPAQRPPSRNFDLKFLYCVRGRSQMTSAKFSVFLTPFPPCQHVGSIYITKITQPPLLHQNLGDPLPPPLFWHHLWMAPYLASATAAMASVMAIAISTAKKMVLLQLPGEKICF